MRSTLSQAVSSRQYNLQPGSPETGQLMSALLMAAMEKLAAMRTTVPTVVDEADDTVTKLMRGLFGNFLTIAGSGVRPLSMVWQLFGQDANFDIPTTNVDWSWYETAVKIYPYTGWPLTQFHDNLGKLIDKAIIRVVTKNENVGEIKMSRMAEMAKYCKLRNIQLEHSRTIITVFMQMLTTEDINTAAVAARLLDQVPQNLKKQSAGYSRMIRYLKHLAEGGEQRVDDNLTIANVYIRRSAAFGKVKSKVSGAWKEGDWAKVKKYCQIVVDTQTKMAVFWRISPDSFRIQNMKVYKQLLDVDFGLMTKSECEAFTKIIIGDAEKNRIPWQVGKKGEFGDEIEPLDDTFVHQIMTGEILEPETEATQENEVATKTAAVAQTKPAEVGFSVFKATVKSQFINQMDKALSPADVCAIIGIPVHTMAAFVTALNPEFVWNRLGESFKDVILDLLKYRSDRTGSHPVKKLLELTTKGSRQIEAQ